MERAPARRSSPRSQRDLRRRDDAALPAGAVDDVQHDAAHRRADVERRVEPAAVAPAPAQPPQRLGRGQEAPRGIGGHRARASGQAAVEQRGDRRLRVGPGVEPEARVERLDQAVAGRDRLDRRRRRRLALGEQVVVAEHRIPRRVEARRVEGPLRRGEQPGVARRVVVGAVVERVGVARLLHAVVARGAGVRAHAAAGEHGAGGVELIALRVVDEVARDHHGLGAQAVERADGGGEELGGERLLGPEGRSEGAPEPVEEGHARGRLLVAHVGVGDLREGGERGFRPAAAAELTRSRRGSGGPPRSSAPSPSRSTSVVTSVEPGGGPAGRSPPQPAARAAAARQAASAARITPPAARRRSARA